MKRSWVWLPLVLLTACKGDKDEEEPLVIPMRSAVEAHQVKATVDPAWAEADQAVSTVLAWAALVSAAEQTQDGLLVDHGDPGATARDPGVGACWYAPKPAHTQFHIDYSPFNEAHPSLSASCEDLIDTVGRVQVNDHPQGPVVFSTQDLQLIERGVRGALGFDRRGAETMHWSAYGTLVSSPLPETNLLPIEIELRQGTFEVDFDGGAALDLAGEVWKMWGVATVSHPDGAQRVIRVGGEDPEALRQPVAAPGAAVSSLDFEVCRCPIEGKSAYTLELQLDRIDVDLNAMKQEADGVTDPILEVAVAVDLSGVAVADRVGCGEYEVHFTPDQAGDTTLELPVDALVAEIGRFCTNQVLDEERCEALKDGVRTAGPLTVELPEERLRLAAQDALLQRLDSGWCRY